jgi:nitrate reductase gamma subunit
MNANYMYSLIAVIVLILLAYVGVAGLHLEVLFGIVIPYAAVAVFILGFVNRLIDWAKSPVPFSIATTGGQQVSLPMVSPNRIDNPNTKAGVIARMALEILLFRSLFRNTKFEVRDKDKFSYELEKWLWLFALAFHYAFFVVLVRHLRFFTEPVPMPVQVLEKLDGFFQVGLPGYFLSGIVLLAAVIYLFLRRVWISQLRYISLPSDYFPLFLIMGIAGSGILMRYFAKIDVTGAKELTMGLVTFSPSIPEGGLGAIYYVHVFLVSVLLAYFPFSKLMHLGGIFFSPTRNLRGNTREFRHENPWNYPVKIHTYQAYEDEFREKMIEAGLPVEKLPEPKEQPEEEKE